MGLSDDPLSIPYGDLPFTPVNTGDASLAGGMLVMPAVVDSPELGPVPALIFRFRNEHGDIGKPTVLVLADPEMAQTAVLVHQCVDRALQVARQRRARDN